MLPVLDYIGSLFVGKTYHFSCDCIVPLDFTGEVKDYEVKPSGEIVLTILRDSGKVFSMGLRHPGLHLEEVHP